MLTPDPSSAAVEVGGHLCWAGVAAAHHLIQTLRPDPGHRPDPNLHAASLWKMVVCLHMSCLCQYHSAAPLLHAIVAAAPVAVAAGVAVDAAVTGLSGIVALQASCCDEAGPQLKESRAGLRLRLGQHLC